MSGFWHVGMCIELLNQKIEMLDDIIEYQDFDEDFTEVKRTRREGERAGTLSLKAAKELGFSVKE
jgi:hypothetical protein